MIEDPYANRFLNWIRARLHEMDATLILIEKSTATLQVGAKKQADKTLSQISTGRKAYEEAIRQTESEAAWTEAKIALEADWASFEAAVADYIKNSPLPSQEAFNLFRARAEAQGKAWDETISALGKKAGMASAKGKQAIDDALTHLKRQADEAKAKLEARQKARSESWAAFKTALQESRAAFDKASHKSLENYEVDPFTFIQNL